MLTPKPDNTQMTQDMSCIRFRLPSDDTSRRGRRLSVEIIYSSDPDIDPDEVSSGASEGAFLRRCRRLGIVPNTSTLTTIAEEGIEVQTPFFPGRIQVNARTGMITILPADEQHDVRKANVMIPRNIPNVTAAIAGRNSTTASKLLPGRIVSLRQAVEIPRFLRVEHSTGSIRGDGSMDSLPGGADEVFAVVRLLIHEDAFALKSVRTNKFIKCDAEGKFVHAVCEELTVCEESDEESTVGTAECFMEEDAGVNLIAVRSVKYNQFWGSVYPLKLKLFSKIEPHGRFEVVPVVHIF
ncbi:hypothetical protein R1sor_019630 [Riccia sorocarpa]|uniref:Uncharacterized protein n=1 Tax=Riccia sorocarpa TaxID=122646 RepID=A0ABD3ID21_9MARC